MAIKLFLKIFFLLPVWLLRCLTFQKSTIINNQILDFQTQVFLKLQSLQANTFDNPNTFNSAQELREELESGRDGLPLNAKPRRFVQTIDHFIPTEFGELKIREYCPERVLMESPILYFHGGGYVLGSISTHDPWLKFFSAEIGAKIFSLEYRLAPENKFPSSVQDSNLALEWLENKLSLPIKKISLCGDSAGAHLAASLSTYRAVNNLSLPLSQCLIYPMIDPACNSKSQIDFSEGFFLSQKAMTWFWEQLIDSKVNLDDPMFNLTIDPKAHLPKTLIITAGFDPLSDEGETYARLLDDSGNEVQQIHYPHLIHGFVNMTALKAAKDATKDWLRTYKKFLRQ
ncbi:MAG: alpha/beta hydrolase [SAR86 cluster bacterium]|nr:alpha/beta hydrolase [SAR86 cluster bacterium]